MVLNILWNGSEFWKKKVKKTIYSQTPLFPMQEITDPEVSMM